MSIFDRKSKADPEDEPAQLVKAGPDKQKKPVRGKPFFTGDPRINKLGRPKTGEALADHIRQLLDAPMKRSGTEEETSILDAGLIALANAFIAGDPAVSKLLLDRGWGKMPEMIILSQADKEPAENWEALGIETLRIIDHWEWMAAGCPNPDAPGRRDAPKIQKAINDSRVLELVKSYTKSQYSPSLTEGEKD